MMAETMLHPHISIYNVYYRRSAYLMLRSILIFPHGYLPHKESPSDKTTVY